MTDPVTYKATIAGKRIFVTDGGGGPSTVDELRAYLRHFPTRELLRFIGLVAEQVEKPDSHGGILQGVAVQSYCLPYLALLAIESSNDHRRGKPLDDAAFANAVRLFNNLEDPMSVEVAHQPRGTSGLEFLVRLGKQQFEVQSEIRHLIPRTLLILRDLWPTVQKATSVSPDADLRTLTGGLGLEEIVLLGATAYGMASGSVLHEMSQQDVAELSSPLREAIDPEAYATLLKWLAAPYSKIREAAKAEMPAASYDLYRFNPLEVHPLVLPELQPVPGRTTYLVPFRRWIWERVTKGLYHDLQTHHRGAPGENPFKVAFGSVFQEYVGLLLREAIGPERVFGEVKYGPKQTRLDSPDWIVVEGDKAVLVEVKQSALFLPTKLWGHLADARDDLKKTLLKASKQLTRFESDVFAGAPGLEQFAGLKRFERLVVTYDNLHFANSVVRDEIISMATANGIAPKHVHVAPVADLEYVLGHCWRGSLFDLLEKKRADADHDMMDFHDWMGHHLAPGADHRNPFLDGVFNDWGAKYGLRPIRPAHMNPSSK